MDKINVIFHIDEMDKWPLILGNVNNMLKEVGEDGLACEVLANSKAISFMIKDDHPLKDKVEKLVNKNIRFCVCQNSLNALEIVQTQLEDYAIIVPSGVVELALKQHEGYAYIKP